MHVCTASNLTALRHSSFNEKESYQHLHQSNAWNNATPKVDPQCIVTLIILSSWQLLLIPKKKEIECLFSGRHWSQTSKALSVFEAGIQS